MASKKPNDQGIVVKAYLSSQEIRRFLIEPGVLTNFDYLKQKAHCIFNIPQDEVLTFSWKDGDNEYIMFSSDEEMLEAINHQCDGVFRLYISRPSVSSSSGNSAVHNNVVCDGCQGEVRGTRYKCVVCPDYDLCAKCENAGKHLEHNMMCLRRPMNPGEWAYWRDIAMQMNPQMAFNPNPPPPTPPPPPHGRPAYPGYYHPQWGSGFPWQCRKMWKKAFKCHQKLQRENSRFRESAACGSTTPLMTECNREKMCDQTGQPKWADTHKEFLKTMGEAVQSMLDPFGIDVSFSVDGAGEAINTKIKTTDTSTEQDKSSEKKGDEVVHVDVDVDKLQTSDSQKSPQRMNVDLDSTPSSPDAQRTAEFIVIDPDDGEEPPTAPKITSTKPLNPKVIHSLELMKRMGFKDSDGWLTKLLIENDANIDKVLDIFQNKCRG